MSENEEKRDRAPGRVLLFTGDGKGKTTAALGILLRASGHRLPTVMVSFIKSSSTRTGEDRAIEKIETASVERGGEGFTWQSEDLERDRGAARAAWERCRAHLADVALELVVLDEITYPVKFGWIEAAEVVAAIEARPRGQHVVMTGRDAAAPLVAIADTVTEMRAVKHAFAAGIPSTRGIEW